MARYEFTYPSILEAEGRMLNDLVRVLARHRMTGLAKQSVLVVMCEAFNNALLHGNKLDPKKKIKVVVTIKKREVTADIIDEGRGGLEKVRKRQPSRKWAESGRGIGIIGHYASSVNFRETERGGLKVSITFEPDDKKILSKC
ncbi:MAG: ATP-binding protein [Candidatus Zixiibacteriota bacterium]|nr:MAG: ATP-binding protein [candidate division Zixibacteria bacterium]